MPNQQICCLCGSTEGPLIMQERPSGKNFKLQPWGFCRSCWDAVHANGHEPELIQAKYLQFLKFLLGGYHLERRFNGNRAAKVVPKNSTKGQESIAPKCQGGQGENNC